MAAAVRSNDVPGMNAAQDAQGRVPAMSTSFALHQLCHSHNQQVHGMLIDPSFSLP